MLMKWNQQTMLRHYCKRVRTATALVVALLLAGCGAPDQEEMAASPGQADFNNHCAGCHGRLGQGRPPAFPPLDGSEWLELPPEALTSIILRSEEHTSELQSRGH